MHLQPIYEKNIFVKVDENGVDEDIFNRGLCLPSDNKMTPEQQDRIIDVIKSCFEWWKVWVEFWVEVKGMMKYDPNYNH